MVIDTDVVLKKLALPKARPHVGIAKFSACVTGFIYARDMLLGATRPYLPVAIIAAILGYSVWKAVVFMRDVEHQTRGDDMR